LIKIWLFGKKFGYNPNYDRDKLIARDPDRDLFIFLSVSGEGNSETCYSRPPASTDSLASQK